MLLKKSAHQTLKEIKIRLLPLLTLLLSCSHTLYTGDGDRVLHISKHANREVIELSGKHTNDNMFYGTMPDEHLVKLGNDFFRRRSEYVSRVEITEVETTWYQWLKFLSLGLFSRKDITVKAVTDIGENEYEVY